MTRRITVDREGKGAPGGKVRQIAVENAEVGRGQRKTAEDRPKALPAGVACSHPPCWRTA
jgi:hypothetical protein